MTLIANSSGILSGKFMIPANIPVGTKAVRAVVASGLSAVAGFTGRGNITTEERRRVTTITENWRLNTRTDPLAQTFTMTESRHVAGVDLWFANPGNRDIIVQIRDTSVGFPEQSVFAEARIKPANVQPSGTATRVVFPAPVWLVAGTEYAVVVLSDSAEASMFVAELGKYDSNANRWITSQPYQVGVLLSSSNASSWTVHQDRDMAFRLLGCAFTATSETVPLGSVTVADASDFVAAMSVDVPATGVSAEVEVTVPGGAVYRMKPGTPIALPARVDGSVSIALKMSGTDKVSPVLYPGVQFIAGDQEASGQYVSRAFAVGTSARVSVTFEALTPGVSTVGVEIQKADGSWQTLSLTSGVDAGDGWVERNYTVTGFTTATSRVRLTLTGTTSARPRVRKLRAVATD